jgi:1,4-dihydroxy-2-naphthoate octaprenyltransferase
MDDDEGSIGGLANPLKPTRQLFIVSNLLDIVGLILSWLISPIFTLINLFLVTLSRLYSWRSIRIKKYAIGSFFMVAFAQGALSYINIKHGIMVKNLDINIFSGSTLMEAGVAALFVGAIYPITQIYQHTEDKRNGVKTISMLVGKIGTLILSGTLFLISIYLIFSAMERSNFLLFGTFMIFPVSYFLYWFVLVTKNREKADYQHTMKMVITASFAMIFALTILILKFFLPH